MPWIDTGRACLFYTDAGNGGPPLLLVHEMGGNLQSWQAAIPRFAAKRRVIAVDLRGAGLSEKPRAPFELADLADDLADIIRALNLPAVAAVGVACGAVVVALLAMRHPDLVQRLVISNGSESMSDPAKEYNRARAAKVKDAGMRAVAETTLGNAFPKGFEHMRAAYLPVFLANDPVGYAETSLALTRLDVPAAAFAAIRCPTLVMSGAHDFVWPPEVGRRLASLIPGAHFKLLPDAAHFPHIQRTDEFVANIENFLGRGEA